MKLVLEERFHSEMQKVQKYIDPDTLKCFPLNFNCAARQRHPWARLVPTRWNKQSSSGSSRLDALFKLYIFTIKY